MVFFGCRWGIDISILRVQGADQTAIGFQGRGKGEKPKMQQLCGAIGGSPSAEVGCDRLKATLFLRPLPSGLRNRRQRGLLSTRPVAENELVTKLRNRNLCKNSLVIRWRFDVLDRVAIPSVPLSS
jgi:hypothetical protein